MELTKFKSKDTLQSLKKLEGDDDEFNNNEFTIDERAFTIDERMFLDSTDHFNTQRLRSLHDSNAVKSSKTYVNTNPHENQSSDPSSQIKSNISKKLIKHFLQ